jgi:hypothetical protein
MLTTTTELANRHAEHRRGGPAWSVLALDTAGGYLVLVQDQPREPWRVWAGPPAPDSAVSSLRYHHPTSGEVSAAAVAVFAHPADAWGAWRDYITGTSRQPLIPHDARVVRLRDLDSDHAPGAGALVVPQARAAMLRRGRGCRRRTCRITLRRA